MSLHAAAEPASQFSVLLRRSKFASFDPQIAQVYTSYGGDVQRGNWGLKRPLPLRRRNAAITVSAFDSKEQQTVWKGGERQNRWIKMWDIVGTGPTVHGRWAEKIGDSVATYKWQTDSEFAPQSYQAPHEEEDVSDVLAAEASQASVKPNKYSDAAKEAIAIPNVYSMSEAQFKRYTARLREQRPAFFEFAKKAREESAKPNDKPIWQDAREATDLPSRFVSRHTFERYHSPDSTLIEQQPHRYGGLTYTKRNTLSQYFLAQPQTGRLFGSTRAVLGSMRPSVDRNMTEGAAPLDWKVVADGGHQDGDGLTKLRLLTSKIYKMPNVVGPKPQGRNSVEMDLTARVDLGRDMTRANPHWPGSKRYVAHRSATSTKKPPMMTTPYIPSDIKPSFDTPQLSQRQQILNTLSGIIQRK